MTDWELACPLPVLRGAAPLVMLREGAPPTT